MGQVEGKVAIVTGGASGIGAACVRTLAREGARLVITDIDDDDGRRLAEEAGNAIYVHHDVTDEDVWPGVIASAEQRFGRVDVMVSNAGIAIAKPLITMTLEEWRRQTAVNIDGVFLSVKHVMPAMQRAGGGSIILMSSVAGLRGSAGLAGYSATKGAVRLLAKSMALECAADNIRVNSVHPGVIVTPIWGKVSASGQNIPLDPNAAAAAIVPVGKAGQAEDIANGVLFLASDASNYMTGSELVIDGGIMAGTVRR
jgi:NAD(P)-dependent dehydrogenase (short-subunit alcohol dehydrogenase family)